MRRWRGEYGRNLGADVCDWLHLAVIMLLIVVCRSCVCNYTVMSDDWWRRHHIPVHSFGPDCLCHHIQTYDWCSFNLKPSYHPTLQPTTKQVSLWDVDHTPVAEDDDTDGVLSFAVHAQFVSALHWAGGSSSSSAKLYTSSYDGTIRILDPGAGAFLRAEVQGLGPEDELSAMDVRADGDVAWLATPEGQMAVADFRAGKLVGSWMEAHNR